MKTAQLSSGLLVAALLLTGSLTVAQSASTDSAAKRKSGSVVAVAPKVEATQNSQAVTNPLYHPSGHSGQNPLNEAKGKVATKTGTGTSNIQGYKDPEDMTTRYRPGNNKTTKAASSVKTPKVDSLNAK